MNQGTILGSQIGRWIILAALVVVLGALLLTIRPVGAQSSAPIDVSYPENSTGRVGSPVYAQDPERRGVNWRLSGDDADDFKVMTSNNAGTLTFETPPDFEDPKDDDTNNLYSVTVRAVDPGGKESAARTFNVLVTNVEEPGTVIVSHNGDEPWYGGLQPKVGVQLLAYATDPDEIQDDVDKTSDDVTWQWYRGNESSAACSDSVSDNCLIDGADESAYTPVAGDVGMHLTVAASYFDKENTASRKSAAYKSMYVTQAAGANDPPTFEQDETSLTSNETYGDDVNTLIDLEPSSTPDVELVHLEIKEDASVGDMVGPGPIAATDPDEGDELTYSIEDSTNGVGHAEFFAIDRATGQITLKKMVNAEADPGNCGTNDQCLVTVTATDSEGDPGAGSRVRLDLQIDIIGVNEPPMITGDNAVSVNEGSESDTEATRDIDAMLDVEGEQGDQNQYTATDVDNTPAQLTWSLSGTDAEFFAFGPTADPHPVEVAGDAVTAGDLRFKEGPDYEDPKDANKDNTYEVTLNVSDGTGTTSLEVKVTVNNVVFTDPENPDTTQEEAGEITLSHIQPRVGVRFVATLKDGDGGIRSQSWEWFDTNPTGATPTPIATSTGGNSASYTPTADDVDDTLYVRVTYLDSTSEDQTQTRTVTAFPVNPPDSTTAVPVVAALETANNAPTFVETVGGEQVNVQRYAREVDEGVPTPVTLSDGTTAGPIVVTDADAPGDLVQFSISGGDSEYFSVTNNATNLEAVITPKSALNYEAPKDADRNNIYVFTITVTDSSGGRDTATVSVTVDDVEEPMSIGTIGNMEVDENSPLRTDVGMPIEPDDPGDSTYQTYELIHGTDEEVLEDDYFFRIHRDDGQIYVNKDLDYEAAPCGINSQCSVRVRVIGWKTDDETNESVQIPLLPANTSTPFDITISDVNEAPSYAGPQTRYVAENAWRLEADDSYKRDEKTGKPATLGSSLAALLAAPNDLYRTTMPSATVASTGTIPANNNADRVAATDPERRVITGLRVSATERLLYTLSGPDAMYFGIYRGTGQIILQEILDFESLPAGKKYFNVKVTATDRAGLSDTTDVTINVVDVNEPPEHVIGLNVLGQSGWNYDENGTDAVGTYEADGSNAETARWSVAGADGSLFMVAPTSGMSTMLRFRSSPNFEMPADAGGNNVYEVTVKVATGGEMDTQAVTVTVTNVEEPGTVILNPALPSVGKAITATLEDDDIVSSESWQWASSTAMDGTFTNISGATDASYEPVAAVTGLWLRASVTYTDGIDRGNVAMMVTEGAVTEVPVNVAPEFESATTTRTIPENTAAGRNIGAPVVATDDNDDTLTYSLEGTDAASFSVVSGTGQLRTRAALDFETKTAYTVVVKATDPLMLSDTINVTINVTDVTDVVEVVPEVPSIVETYDTDGVSGIQILELYAAINAYFDGDINSLELFELVNAYFG